MSSKESRSRSRYVLNAEDTATRSDIGARLSMRQRVVQAFSSLLSRPIIGHRVDVATLPEWKLQASAMVVPVADGITLETLPKSLTCSSSFAILVCPPAALEPPANCGRICRHTRAIHHRSHMSVAVTWRSLPGERDAQTATANSCLSSVPQTVKRT